ncbi:GrpB family protein [Rudaeicoccus suwonensis]|uniref:GrpB-like predicted nucleotidyltransferase (UPF0157 family) n=1 Tax=Rudaeicoccus suwonensis TaxID=657409 RepID=A0A561DX04_9MICO|nr:GrpB family protein [Rudaeicoccus suwonensis]TWE07905.1 GrpB-like predicted nucleotidyltransferase (UPF0157 family) [Rudaeicoccus suwonensis]
MQWAAYRRTEVQIRNWDPVTREVFGFVRDQIIGVHPRAGVEHIGSTSVPGLAGKNTVDVMVLPQSVGEISPATSALEGLGLCHARGSRAERPFLLGAVTDDDGNAHFVHIHVVVAGSDEATTQRGFAAALRTDPTLRFDYAAVKKRVIDAGVVDPLRYSMDKGDWVVDALRRLGLPPLPDDGPPPPNCR